MTNTEAKAYVDRFKLVNRIALEEARRRTPSERFRRFTDFHDWLNSIGRRLESNDKMEIYLKWAKIKQAYQDSPSK